MRVQACPFRLLRELSVSTAQHANARAIVHGNAILNTHHVCVIRSQAIEPFRQHMYELRRLVLVGSTSERQRLIRAYLQVLCRCPLHTTSRYVSSTSPSLAAESSVSQQSSNRGWR